VELRPVAGQPEPDALGGELRIYLGDSAEVVFGAPLLGATLEARIAEATAALGEARDTLVTWLEAVPGPTGGVYVVVIVGRRNGRAVVDVGNIPASDGSTRLLALRVGAFLDETLATPVARAVLDTPIAPRLSAAPAERWIGAELVGGIAGDFALGRFSIVLDQRLAPSVEVQLTAGIAGSLVTTFDTLSVDAQRLGAAARIVWRASATLDAFAQAGIDGARLHARAVSSTGAIGEVTRWGAVGRGTLGGHWWFAPQIALRLELGGERAFVVERFAVEGAMRAEVGRLAPVITGGFLARF